MVNVFNMALKDDLMETCKFCKTKFPITDGFLGTEEDYKRLISNTTPLEEVFECSFNTFLISVCSVCVKKAKETK